jgi:hypothetical protein
MAQPHTPSGRISILWPSSNGLVIASRGLAVKVAGRDQNGQDATPRTLIKAAQILPNPTPIVEQNARPVRTKALVNQPGQESQGLH